jgi:hypothetical protein
MTLKAPPSDGRSDVQDVRPSTEAPAAAARTRPGDAAAARRARPSESGDWHPLLRPAASITGPGPSKGVAATDSKGTGLAACL